MRHFKSTVVRVLGIFCAVNAAVSADVKVDEQVVGPAGKWMACAVSPHGAHIAALSLKGSRNVVLVDGVSGPAFDQLLMLDGTPYSPGPDSAIIWRAQFIPVLFSDDGAHYAYFARINDEYIAVLDGKESARGKCGNGISANARTLSFSPAAKHLCYIELSDQGEHRVVMDGKPEPWSYDEPHVVFSPDGARYAYGGTTRDATGNKTKWSVIDGKQVKYFGERLSFSVTGRLVSVAPDETKHLYTVLFDGKPLVQGVAINLAWISPQGDQVAAVVQPKPTDPRVLTIDGKAIPGTEDVRVENVYFSPDGKHYAALCSKSNGQFMLIDGKKGQIYQSITHTSFGDTAEGISGSYLRLRSTPQSDGEPAFTPDSSKFVYRTLNGGKWFVVIDDEESDGFDNINGPIVGNPARVAYSATTKAHQDPKYPAYVPLYDVFVDGKVAPPFRTRPLDVFAFSPDGAHYAFVCDVFGENTTSLVVDGKDVPGVSVFQMVHTDQSNNGGLPPLHFVFTQDGKHIAYYANDTRNRDRRGLWVDDKFVFKTDDSERVIFTSDSKHVMWSPMESDAPGQMGAKPHRTLYIDGRPALKFRPSALDTMAEGREMSPDGVLTLLTLEDGTLKRYRVTPSSDTSLASLLDGAPATETGRTVVDNPALKESPSSTRASTESPESVIKPATFTTSDRVGSVVAPQPKVLIWADLVNHPERWPAQTRLTTDLRFGTDILRAGTPLEIDRVSANSAHLIAPQGFGFNAEPRVCDLLQAANALWAGLTPSERELTYDSLLSRPELWPLRLTINRAFDFSGGRHLNKGDLVELMGVEEGKLVISPTTHDTHFMFKPEDTDLLIQARKFAAGRNTAPGRLLEELRGKLINAATGESVTLEASAAPRYYVVYLAARWCPYSQKFTPQLLELYKEMKPKHPEFEVIYVPAEKSAGEMQQYAKEVGFPWPAVDFEQKERLSVIAYRLSGRNSTPVLAVLDRYGNIVIDPGTERNEALRQLEVLWKQPPANPPTDLPKGDVAQVKVVEDTANANPPPPETSSIAASPSLPPPVMPKPAEAELLDPSAVLNDCMLVNRDARNTIHTQLKAGVFEQRYRGQRVKYSGIVDAVKKVEGFVVFKGAGKWPENYHVEVVFPPDKMSVLDKLQKGQRLEVEADIAGFTLPQMDTGIPGIMGPSRTIKLSEVAIRE